MEWKVLPQDVHVSKLVSFDLTRQRMTKTWNLPINYHLFSESNKSTQFPFNYSVPLDNEMPNDDGGTGSEDRDPKNYLLYSFDAPSTARNHILDDYLT